MHRLQRHKRSLPTKWSFKTTPLIKTPKQYAAKPAGDILIILCYAIIRLVVM
jgi:hypothetical protein